VSAARGFRTDDLLRVLAAGPLVAHALAKALELLAELNMLGLHVRD
jgi:hypothetical protein